MTRIPTNSLTAEQRARAAAFLRFMASCIVYAGGPDGDPRDWLIARARAYERGEPVDVPVHVHEHGTA